MFVFDYFGLGGWGVDYAAEKLTEIWHVQFLGLRGSESVFGEPDCPIIQKLA
jgi:hypothetical protein